MVFDTRERTRRPTWEEIREVVRHKAAEEESAADTHDGLMWNGKPLHAMPHTDHSLMKRKKK